MDSFDPENVGSPESISFLFNVSMWWKIFYGCIRVWMGLILLKHVGTSFTDIFSAMMSHEIITDPNDVVYQFIYQVLEDHSFTVTYFVALYLLFWGIIDIVFSGLLLKHVMWAFPVSITLMSSFVCYEIYRVIHTKSVILLCFIILGMGIIFLVYDEYLILRRKQIITLSNSKPSDPPRRQS